MNHWGTEAYGMGLPMNPMNPMMHAGIMMENLNVPPMNPPPPVPLPLIGPAMPDIMQIEDDDLTNENQNQESQTNDVSSSQSTNRRSRDRGIPNNKRDNRDREQGKNLAERRHRSRSRDRYDRLNRFNDRNDRSDRNRIDKSRIERKTKWDGSPNDKHLLPMPSMVPMAPIAPQGQGMAIGPIAPGQMNMGMMPGIMQYPGNGMMSSNIMMNNMIPPTNMEGQHMMMTNMGMMPNIMSNMMDQTMIVMNQPLMQPMPNQPIYMNSGVLLPPIPGTQIPQRRDRPKGCRTAFIGGLPPNISPDALNEIFQRFGSIHEIKSPKDGIYYVRFERPECVESSFMVSGYRFKYHDQTDNDASTLYIDYALNRDDQAEYERVQRMRDPTPPRIEPFTPNNLAAISEKIKSETEFAEAAPTLVGWLERGECNKKFANQFYSLIQASNNQIRRLFSEKMQLDEEFQNLKISIRDKFAHVVMQFEQVAKILSAAKHQRVSDHFTKQQRRNIEMWLKMTEEVDNLKEEINAFFDEDEVDKTSKNSVPLEKYEELKKENENLTYELEGYKNEAYLAKDEAERKFEKFKAHFIAQQALQKKSVFPPLPQPNIEPPLPTSNLKPQPPPPTPDDDKVLLSGASVPPTEAKLISILTAFLMVHPLGASLDYLVSYVRSMNPNVTQATVLSTLQKYKDIFTCKTTGVGACIEHRWYFVTFDLIKSGK